MVGDTTTLAHRCRYRAGASIPLVTYEKQLKELQEAYGEAMLELRARKKLQSLLGEEEK